MVCSESGKYCKKDQNRGFILCVLPVVFLRETMGYVY